MLMKKRVKFQVLVLAVLVLATFFSIQFFSFEIGEFKLTGHVSIDLLDPSQNNTEYSTSPITLNFSANVTGNSSSEIVNISLLINGIVNETLDSNIWDDLSGTDEEGFFSEIRDISVSPIDELVYIAIFSGKFGAYNRTSNTTENLSTTDPGDWMGTSQHVESVSVSPIDGLVYTGSSSSKLGVYNRTSNVWDDLRGTDIGDWMASSFTVSTISVSPINGLVYLGLPSGNFGAYNRTSNVTENLSATDPGGWADGPYSVNGISVSSVDGLVYTAINSGKFGAYNRTSNVWEDLGTTDTGNWISVSHVNDVSVSPIDGLVYVVAASGKFGAYNRTSNITEDLSSTDTGGWVGTDNTVGVSVSPINGLVYTVGINGKFGAYNRTSNVWTDLRATDPGNWANTYFINTVSVSPINGLVYTGGQSVRFGEYRFRLPNDIYEFANRTFSSDGNYNWTIQSWGSDGNLYEETRFFTIDTTPSTNTDDTDDTGGSSGGGGASTPGEGKPTVVKTHLLVEVISGEPTTISTFEGTGVAEITIKVNQKTNNVKIKVSKYKSKPSEVSKEFTRKNYRYLQINTENLNENLESAIIKFEVEKTWFLDNGLDKNDLAVFKFDEASETWNELETNFDSEDDNFYFYTIELDSFSFFVLGEKSKIPIVSDIVDTVTESYDRAKQTKNGLIIWWSIFAAIFVGIFAIGFLVLRKLNIIKEESDFYQSIRYGRTFEKEEKIKE